jgi:hypothetical protein
MFDMITRSMNAFPVARSSMALSSHSLVTRKDHIYIGTEKFKKHQVWIAVRRKIHVVSP